MLKTKLQRHIATRHILSLLLIKDFGKPRYTYHEISKELDYPVPFVYKVAKAYKLERV